MPGLCGQRPHRPYYFKLVYMRTGPLGQSELLVYTKYAQWAYYPLFTNEIGKKREYFLDLLTKLLLRSNSLVNPGSITQVFWGRWVHVRDHFGCSCLVSHCDHWVSHSDYTVAV